jgi:hypothetical protein
MTENLGAEFNTTIPEYLLALDTFSFKGNLNITQYHATTNLILSCLTMKINFINTLTPSGQDEYGYPIRKSGRWLTYRNLSGNVYNTPISMVRIYRINRHD